MCPWVVWKDLEWNRNAKSFLRDKSVSRKRQCKPIFQSTIRTYWKPAQTFQYPCWKLLAHKQIKKNVMRLLMEILENHWGLFSYIYVYIYNHPVPGLFYETEVSSEIIPGSDGVESSCEDCDGKDEAAGWGGNSKAWIGISIGCGLFSPMARCRAMKHHLSEGFCSLMVGKQQRYLPTWWPVT